MNQENIEKMFAIGEALLKGEPDRAFFEVRKRRVPGAEASAEELNGFMRELGYADIGECWIELSLDAAAKYGDACAKAAYARGGDPSRRAASDIVKLLQKSTRFFTNGILVPIADDETGLESYMTEPTQRSNGHVYKMYKVPQPFTPAKFLDIGYRSSYPILPKGALSESGYVAVEDAILIFVWFLIKGEICR